MATSVQIQKQFEALHRDAEKVLASINTLSHDLSCESKVGTDPGSLLDLSALKVDMNAVKRRLEETSHVVASRAKELDSQVHNNPYGYIAGAMGVGALAGWLLERRLYHSSSSVMRS